MPSIHRVPGAIASAALGVGAVASATLLSGAFGPPALADDDVVQRAAGDERIATSVAASAEFRDQADDALLATATDFPDALAATALAAGLDAPLLLTARDELPTSVADELDRLDVERVHLLGGPGAITGDVEQELADAGHAVERIAGHHRFETARQLALEAGAADTDEVVLALGAHPEPERAWPDAVASGALAASLDRVPTLLTAHDELPWATGAALDELDPDRVIVVGGPHAIDPVVVAEVQELGFETVRVSGHSRYGTSVALAHDALARNGHDAHPIVLATGADFPDALAAGALAGNVGAPLVLTPSTELAPVVDEYLRDHDDHWSGAIVVGGKAAASSLVTDQVAAALRGEPRPEPEPEPEGDDDEVVRTFEGKASYYGSRFHGSSTACGGTFDMHALTTAAPDLSELPCGTRLRVTNTANGRSVEVTVTDKGPFTGDRVLDLSRAAAEEIGMVSSGTAHVRAEVLAD